MEQLLEYIPEGYTAPWWIISTALAAKLFGLDKVLLAFYNNIIEPWLCNVVKRSDEKQRDRLANYVNVTATNDIVYGRYLSFGRHLIGVAWSVLSDLRAGEVTEEKVLDRLRVGSRDSIQTAKDMLGRHMVYTSRKKLSYHLEQMGEDRLLGFYAPIVTAITELKRHGKGLGYEELRITVLMEIDIMIAEAVDLILKDNNDGTT